MEEARGDTDGRAPLRALSHAGAESEGESEGQGKRPREQDGERA